MNTLLIAGGWSSEREISLRGATGIEEALVSLGHTVRRFDPRNELHELLNAASGADFAFISLHGSPGEDGLIQALLDSVGCPYQGSGPAGSFLALNKAAAKIIYRQNGLPTADWVLLTRRPAPGWKPPFAFPIFIKHNTGGSSLGMEKVTRPEDLEAALDRLFALGGEYIVEPALVGVELTCGVLGEEALAPILIRCKGDAGTFFDFANKYNADGAEEVCPAPIPAAAFAAIQAAALAAHKALGLSGYSRTDFILSEDGSFFILETNTLPGMTTASLIPKEAAEAGMSYTELVERLIALGLERSEKRRGTPSAV